MKTFHPPPFLQPRSFSDKTTKLTLLTYRDINTFTIVDAHVACISPDNIAIYRAIGHDDFDTLTCDFDLEAQTRFSVGSVHNDVRTSDR